MRTVEIMLRRKFVVSSEDHAMEIEADVEKFPRITDFLIPDLGGYEGPADETVEPQTLNVPYKEFRELVFFLPKFEELPILSLALQNQSVGASFIARCIDGDESSIGDEVYISTEGFDYPRYKSAVLGRAKRT